VSSLPVSMPRDLDVPSWHLLPPVVPPVRVLYLGTGGGDVAARLALSFGPLLIVESSLGRACATRARSGALGAGQVLTVCGDVRRLPLRPASLDLAVLDVPRAHPEAQLRHSADALLLLVSLHSGLKPGGFLCLRLHDASTEEAGTRRRHGRLSMLVSLTRFRRLLRDSAYGDIRIWCAYPDCADPKFIVEWQQPVFDYFVHHFGRNSKARLRAAAQHLFNAVRLLKYTAPGYLVLARRPMAING
jgi:SAM-dependent methyltransferase